MLDLEVTLVGSNDLIKLAARGKAERQWNPDPAPVELRTYVEFNRKAATPRAKTPSAPYLNLMLELTSKDKGDKPLRVRVDAVCQRSETTELAGGCNSGTMPWRGCAERRKMLCPAGLALSGVSPWGWAPC